MTKGLHVVKLARSTFRTLVVIAFLLIGPLGVIVGAADETPLNAGAAPWSEIAFVGVIAVLFATVCYLSARALTKESDKTLSVLTATAFALFIASSACYFIALAGQILVRLAADGHLIVFTPTQSSVTVGTVYRQLLWHAVDTVPVLNIPNSLSWERPIRDPAPLLGIASVMLRLIMVLIVIASAKTIIQHGRVVSRGDSRTEIGTQGESP
jgi:hypothetical protein